MARRVHKASWTNDLVTYLRTRETLELSIADFELIIRYVLYEIKKELAELKISFVFLL